MLGLLEVFSERSGPLFQDADATAVAGNIICLEFNENQHLFNLILFKFS